MAIKNYILIFCLLLIGSAHADEYAEFSFQINGVSHHSGDCAGHPCDNSNPGFGFETLEKGTWPFRVTAGYLENSQSHNSFYFGLAKTYRFGNKYGFEIGGVAGWMYYPTTSGSPNITGPTKRNNVLAILPMAVFDLSAFRINVLYIPEIKDETSATWFLQTAIPIKMN